MFSTAKTLTAQKSNILLEWKTLSTLLNLPSTLELIDAELSYSEVNDEIEIKLLGSEENLKTVLPKLKIKLVHELSVENVKFNETKLTFTPTATLKSLFSLEQELPLEGDWGNTELEDQQEIVSDAHDTHEDLTPALAASMPSALELNPPKKLVVHNIYRDISVCYVNRMSVEEIRSVAFQQTKIIVIDGTVGNPNIFINNGSQFTRLPMNEGELNHIFKNDYIKNKFAILTQSNQQLLIDHGDDAALNNFFESIANLEGYAYFSTQKIQELIRFKVLRLEQAYTITETEMNRRIKIFEFNQNEIKTLNKSSLKNVDSQSSSFFFQKSPKIEPTNAMMALDVASKELNSSNHIIDNYFCMSARP